MHLNVKIDERRANSAILELFIIITNFEKVVNSMFWENPGNTVFCTDKNRPKAIF